VEPCPTLHRPAVVGKFTIIARMCRKPPLANGFSDDFCGEVAPTVPAHLPRSPYPKRFSNSVSSKLGESADAATVERVPLICSPPILALLPDPVRFEEPLGAP